MGQTDRRTKEGLTVQQQQRPVEIFIRFNGVLEQSLGISLSVSEAGQLS